ncbi:MAG: hypothetical protein ACI4Q6_06305 [Huintestinicola sp.]
MWNIVKALNYQTRRDNVTIYSILVGIAMSATVFIDIDLSEMNGGVFSIGFGEMIPISIMLLSVVLATRICAWDQSDKTINYEMLSGHERKSVFFSRVIVSLIWCMALTAVLVAVPIIAVSLICGWGEVTELKGVLLRYVLLFFPIIRMICCFIFLSFLTGSFLAALISSYLITEAENMIYMVLNETTDIRLGCGLGISNMYELMNFNSRMGFINGEDVYIYDSSLPSDVIVKTVIFSLAASAVYLIGGYILFRKRDMK